MIAGSVRKSVLVAVLLVAGVAFAAGISSDVLQKFSELEQKYSIPNGILAKFAKVESNGNAAAVNPSTQATGLFQWIPRYWYSFTREVYGRELPISEAKNPGVAAAVTSARIKQAQNRLGPLIEQSIGKDNMSVGLYLEHFLGEAGARKFLTLYKQNPGGSAVAAFPKAASQNPKWFGGNPTFSQVVNKMAAEFKQPGVTQIRGYEGPVSDVPNPAAFDQRQYDPPAPEPPVDYPTDYDAIFKEEQQKYLEQHPELQQPNPQSQQGQNCVPRTYCQGTVIVQQDASCSTRVVRTCDYGCSGTQCLPQQCPQGSIMQNGQCVRIPQQQSQNQPLSSAFSPGGMQQQPMQQPSQTGGGQTPSFPTNPSSFDSISSILKPEETKLPQADTGTPAYDRIVSISGQKPATIAQGATDGGQNTPPLQGGLQNGSPISVATQPLGAGKAAGGIQTFTSEDLRDDPNAAGGFNAPESGVLGILSNLKNILLRIVAFVTPR